MRKLKTLFLAGLCSVGILSAQTYDVLFIVDMNEVADPFTTPEVNGTFNVWCGGCAPMSDDNGDNIWELTIPWMQVHMNINSPMTPGPDRNHLHPVMSAP